MAWWDFFKVFSKAFTPDPISRQDNSGYSSAGSHMPDALPDLRAAGAGGGVIPLRDTNEFVDLSTVTNRMHRYKEYERLRNMPEIEMAMVVFADEACLAGNTLVATPAHGYKTIQWLAENMADEKFLVYCWDFTKDDFALGWAYAPRKTKTAPTVEIVFDDGTKVICTLDHRILNAKKKWVHAGDLRTKDEVLAFHRVDAKTDLRQGQFPRIYSHLKGWIHERQFVDEWRLNRDMEQYAEANKLVRMITGGMSTRQIIAATNQAGNTIQNIVEGYGFTNHELQRLVNKKKETRRIVGVFQGPEIDVYDLSVQDKENFCTDWGVVHNCQRDEDGRVFRINTKNKEIQEELEFLAFHRKMLNLDQKRMWNKAKNLFINGDDFEEIVINPMNPKEGIKRLVALPPDSMYRIETTQGRLVEFQQSKEGPDYQSLSRVEVTQATDSDLAQSTAIRFAPEQVIHTKIGDDRKTFYPYGVSLIESARGPAHQLRLMEDAMVVYRLCLVGNSRVRTNNGWKYIKDIMKGDKVYTLNPQGDIVESNVVNQNCNGEKDVFRVRSKHVEFTGTATHPVLVMRNGEIQYVEIQNLIPNKDRLLCIPHEGSIDATVDVKKEIPRWLFNAKKSDRETFVRAFFDSHNVKTYLEPGEMLSTIELEDCALIEDLKELWSSAGLCSEHIHKIEDNDGKITYSLTISDRELPETEFVLSVVHVGQELVYDIEVDNEEHNFIVNGTCVHNSRAPERRIFYVDVQNLTPARAEALIERMKDQLRKKKIHNSRGGAGGASAVEERWHAPAADEDYWIPIRPNNNTRIETLPGASNLGEIDDTVYFRNKLFVALNFPKNYYNNEDVQSTRVSLSAQDVKFARMIERLQSHIEDSLWEVFDRHLKLRGYPEESYEDLTVKMTPPSEWRELSRAEVVSSRIQNAASVKGAGLQSDYDVLLEWMKYSEEDAKKMLARNKIQKLEELKLQIIAQNPELLGVGVPGPDEEQVSTEPSEKNPMLGGEPDEESGEEGNSPIPNEGGPEPMPKDNSGGKQMGQVNVPTPSDEDIKKYNLDIKDYAQEMDKEEVDFSEI